LTVRLTFNGLKRFREMAVRHEQWIIELLGGLSSDEKEAMINELGKLKSHINGANSTTQKFNQRLQPRRVR